MKKAPLELKYYLAGPMTGHPDHNYPAFEKIATRLRCQGYMISSPHEIDYNETAETRGTHRHSYYMRRTLALLLECDAIILLEGWRDSRGAMAELGLATSTGMGVYFINDRITYPYELP